MALLAKGDVLVVTRLDRLARSTRDLLNLLGTIGEKGAGFKSLRDAWADTTTAHGRLMLTVLGGLAEFVSIAGLRESVFGLIEGVTSPKTRSCYEYHPPGLSRCERWWAARFSRPAKSVAPRNQRPERKSQQIAGPDKSQGKTHRVEAAGSRPLSEM
jgi:hypothetical protein